MEFLEKIEAQFVQQAIGYKELHEIWKQATIASQKANKKSQKTQPSKRQPTRSKQPSVRQPVTPRQPEAASRQKLYRTDDADSRRKHVDDAKRAAGLAPAAGIDKTKRAEELRADQTNPELKLGSELIKGAGNWFAQVPLYGYIVDFFCPQALLIVEVDGPSHKHSQSSDASRTEHLQGRGLKVIRFTNAQVLDDVKAVRKAIDKEFTRRKNEAFNQRMLELEWNLFRYGTPEPAKPKTKKRSQENRAPQRKYQWYCHECPGHFASFNRNYGKCTKNKSHRVVRICELCKIRIPGDDLKCEACVAAREIAIQAAGMGGTGPSGTILKSSKRGQRVTGAGN